MTVSTLKALREALVQKYPGLRVDIYDRGNHDLNLSLLVVPKVTRGAGIGAQVMRELIGYANDHGLRIVLTPSNDFGGSVPRLKAFYKRFGFVENKGRNKDYTIMDGMYREAQKPGVAVLNEQLVQAVTDADEDLVTRLLQQGADPNNSNGPTRKNGNVTDLMYVDQTWHSDHGPDGRKKSVLHIAAFQGDGGIVRRLLDAGANIDATDELGWTALMFACSKDWGHVARDLVARGADTMLLRKSSDAATCALGLVGLHKPGLVDALLDYPRPKEALQKVLCNATHYRRNNEVECDPQLALHITTRALDAGADLNGMVDRTRALDRAIVTGSMPVFELLLERGAALEQPVGPSALIFACSRGRAAFVRMLGARGAVVGEDEMDAAIQSQDDEVILAALENCHQNGVDHRLMRLSRSGDVPVLEAVIKAGDNVKSARFLFETFGEDVYQKTTAGAPLLRVCKPNTKQMLMSLRMGESIAQAVDEQVVSPKSGNPKNGMGML